MPQIRFHIDGQPSTDWIEETILHRQQGTPTAVAIMSELRTKFPMARIKIERRGDARIPNPVKMYRFKIEEGDVTGYTHPPVLEKDKDALLEKVRHDHPKAEITEEVV
jgi:hypothetical protein